MADQKITQLGEDTAPALTDILPTVEDPSGTPVTKKVTVANLLSLIYPVGSIYTSVNSTNPGTSLGFGTWTAFGAGKVPVGFDSGDTDFDTDEETGGAKTVSGAAHAHDLGDTGWAQLDPIGTGDKLWQRQINTPDWTANAYVQSSDVASGSTTATQGAALDGATESATPSATSVVQPYIVVRMWKRTA